MWCTSSIHLQKHRDNDIIADSMGTVLHMLALKKVPTQLKYLTSGLDLTQDEDESDAQLTIEHLGEIQTKIYSDDLEEIWNMTIENAGINDAISSRFVAIVKISADLQAPCIHSPLCFAFSLRLLFSKRATEALDICEYWLNDLEKTAQLHPECFVWYRVGILACKGLACAVLSQGIKACDLLKQAQNDLEIYDLPGLRAYISFIGLLAAGALCESRQKNAATCDQDIASLWKFPNLWKQSAISHILRSNSILEPMKAKQYAKLTADAKSSVSNTPSENIRKRRLSNVFEDYEFHERATFLNDSELVLLTKTLHTSLVAGMARMGNFNSEVVNESKCIFAEMWDQMTSWKSELDRVIVSVSGQTLRL